MLRKIIPKEGELIKEILLCDALYIEELKNPRIVPLFGPNGIGKSTVIKAILEAGDQHRKKSSIEVIRDSIPMKIYSYRNSEDNDRDRKAKTYHESFDPAYLVRRMNAQRVSEGQSIIYSVMGLFELIGTGKLASRNEDGEILVIIDEIDSGLSIDNLDVVMRKLKHTARRRKDVQVIFSFNNPHVVRYFPEVLSLYTGHPITLHSTEDMLAEIEAHKKDYRKRRYYRSGVPKVFD